MRKAAPCSDPAIRRRPSVSETGSVNDYLRRDSLNRMYRLVSETGSANDAMQVGPDHKLGTLVSKAGWIKAGGADGRRQKLLRGREMQA